MIRPDDRVCKSRDSDRDLLQIVHTTMQGVHGHVDARARSRCTPSLRRASVSTKCETALSQPLNRWIIVPAVRKALSLPPYKRFVVIGERGSANAIRPAAT